MHLILDLDGTLVHCDDQVIYPRPYLHIFMKVCFELFETVSIWTAAGKEYANVVVDMIRPKGHDFLFIRYDKNCTIRYNTSFGEFSKVIVKKKLRNIWKAKKYRRMGITKYNTIIIEDTPSNCSENYGNAVYVPEYRHPPNNSDTDQVETDKVLLYLLLYLYDLVKCDNVRSKEKRTWLDIYSHYDPNRL